jgi:outer membrane immunogenic protein
MRKLLIGIALSGFVAAPATAADMPVKAAPPPVVELFNWSGLYIGGHVGYGWGHTDWNNITDGIAFVFTGASVSQRPRGVIGGGHIGYNVQSGAWVFGLEGSYSVTSIKKTEFDVDIPPSGNGDTFESRIRDMFTLTGRLGYAWNRTLLYAKGGFASADVRIRAVDTLVLPVNDVFTSSERHNGWTLGAGLEHAVTQNFIVGIEYNYFSFGDERHAGITSVRAVPISTNVDATLHAVLARLSYKFGGPVVARY